MIVLEGSGQARPEGEELRVCYLGGVRNLETTRAPHFELHGTLKPRYSEWSGDDPAVC